MQPGDRFTILTPGGGGFGAAVPDPTGKTWLTATPFSGKVVAFTVHRIGDRLRMDFCRTGPR